MIKQIPRLLGPGLNKAGKFPSPISGNRNVEEVVSGGAGPHLHCNAIMGSAGYGYELGVGVALSQSSWAWSMLAWQLHYQQLLDCLALCMLHNQKGALRIVNQPLRVCTHCTVARTDCLKLLGCLRACVM